MKFETERLILRELTMNDLDDLHEILSDPETMQHYPNPFSYEKSKQWIEWNLKNYATHGFGLWAVILKAENKLIGDCGLTYQPINGEMQPEIGYHIHKAYMGKGYGSEAAMACRNYGFEELKFDRIYSYMKYTNIASQKVALKNGMTFIEEIADEKNEKTRIYAITKSEYKEIIK